MDIKKLGRIPDGGGHRKLGRPVGKKNNHGHGRGPGYAFLHHAVDDHSRLAYSEILADERKETAAGFWNRANAFFCGIGVAATAVMTDNGSCYRSAAAAEESAKAAAGSLQVAHGEQARATERTDVDWAREELDDRPGHVALRNVGSSTAYEVQALVAINGESFDLDPMDVPPLGYVDLDATAIYDV